MNHDREVGYLVLEGYCGRTQQLVEVIGRTPKRLRIRALSLTRLAGRQRSLEPGQTALVPTMAVRARLRCSAETLIELTRQSLTDATR